MKEFDELLNIMRNLRDPKKGCPWDRKQTHESLRSLMLEELYEIFEAIDTKNTKLLKEELGDMLLHIIFHSQIAEEKNNFTIKDVLLNIIKKLKYRHPHIFGKIKVKNVKDVKQNWEKIKQKEKKRSSILEGVPKSLPALIKAKRIQSKASNTGFDWKNAKDILKKIKEEIKEFEEQFTKNNRNQMVGEIGDILFSIVNIARKLDIDPEFALEKSNKKFIKRFNYIEENLKDKIFNSNIDEMEYYWEKSKDKKDV